MVVSCSESYIVWYCVTFWHVISRNFYSYMAIRDHHHQETYIHTHIYIYTHIKGLFVFVTAITLVVQHFLGPRD
ncbi:hypothetical protein VIGAN_09189800, partial [Vigna angularis var. angularis]